MKARRPSIEQLADWFLSKESMTPKKLQKLCYYAVAWGYALMGRQVFDDDEFQAWVHGPVSPTLYQKYKKYGWNLIKPVAKKPVFPNDVEELLESIWATYGAKSGNELEVLSHTEDPWRKARGNCTEFEPCKAPIKDKDMRVFYQSILSET